MGTNNSLTVYSASAGSGKTFTLAVKYIELLMEHPESYRSILAVTFTNKATDEMKLRILSQLYGLASSLPDSIDYANKIKADFHEMGKNISDDTIKENAQKALEYLLHNYNYFRIQTIDAFFQQIIRNMARELNLNANFKLSLNDQQIEEFAIDDMIDKLLPKSDLMKWILDFINKNINEDQNWNIINDIKKFGMKIFSDIYKEHKAELDKVFQEPDFFDKFTSLMYSIIKKAEDDYLQIYTRYNEILNKYGVCVDDFKKNKSGACGYFEKFGKGLKEMTSSKNCNSHFNKTAEKACTDITTWISKADLGKGLEPAATELMQLLNETEPKRLSIINSYKSAQCTIQHINELRLLGSISDKVEEMNVITNRFQLSATQNLLNTMIDKNDAPFIYEKIGTQINHIMIDEFQDTSIAQWQNFKILLEDCLSQYSSCLIVGDVKQSIYRWRSSDWRLLQNIKKEFPNYEVEPTLLDTNYRSEANIIKFNNAFFENAAQIQFNEFSDSNNSIGDIYTGKNIRQEISPKRKDKCHNGYVGMQLIPNIGYKTKTLKNVAELIRYLLDQGVKQSDIAILTRRNSDITLLGEYLLNEMPDITWVSDEAFILKASLAVRTIITALRVIISENDYLSLATLARYTLMLNDDDNPTATIFDNADNLEALLPIAFRKDNRISLSQMPIYELTESIYNIFGLSKLENEKAYICKFFDSLSTYLADFPATIADVINEWDTNMYKTAIQSDQIEGIRLLTIHKSKGLEFDNVIIPFCDWALERMKDNKLWVSPKVSPYSKLPLVPVKYNKSNLQDTIYEDDYNEEHFQNMVDNMNLLYVAFTRAAKNLFVYGKQDKPKIRNFNNSRSAILLPTLEAIVKSDELEGCTIEEDDEGITFNYGELYINNDKENEHTEKVDNSKANVFKPKITPIYITNNIDNGEKDNISFRQSNKSREFVAPADDDDNDEEKKAYIKLGTILHRIFSTIETADDIDKALIALEQEGELYSSTISKDKLLDMLHKRLESSKVKEWFSHGWHIFNECTIIEIDPITGKLINRRPDRVMTNGEKTIVVDFKFAAPNMEHHYQVAQYINLLTEMGYTNVRGYLWYVYTNKIEEVKA